MAVVCPECESPIVVDEDLLEEGETVECEECGASLEVTGTDPVELASVEESGYDEEDAPSLRTDDGE